MYTLVKTLVLPKAANASWQPLDAGNLIVSTLYKTYRKIIVVLDDDQTGTRLIADMEQLKPEYVLYGNTLAVLMVSIGTRGLDTLPALPNEKVGYVHYVNMNYAGYHLKLAKAGRNLPEGASVDLKTDVLVTRDGMTNYQALFDYGLFTVNGFYHRSSRINDNVYVLDAGTSMQHAHHNQAGLTSFMEVGKIHQVGFDDTNVAIPPGYEGLKDRVAITVPEDMVGKAMLLVLGGYLMVPQPGSFYQVSDRTWFVDLDKLGYIDRLLESSLYLDLKSLGLPPSPMHDDMLNIEAAWKDETIRKYFKLSQSFMVFVKTDNLIVDKIHLRQMKVPGTFTAYTEPVHPLVLDNGRIVDYFKRKDGDRWAVTMIDSYHRLWVHDRGTPAGLKNIFKQLSFDVPYHFSQGCLLVIGAYKNGV